MSMATINNGSKQFIVCSIANVQQSLIGCTSVAKADRPAQKGLESASISHVGESPPGWRRVAEFGYDDGLEYCLYCTDWHAVVPQSAQSEQRLCTGR